MVQVSNREHFNNLTAASKLQLPGKTVLAWVLTERAAKGSLDKTQPKKNLNDILSLILKAFQQQRLNLAG